MKLNKENWKDVEYGQMVDHIEINERDLEKRAKAKYVSVEHLKTLDLRIKGIAAEEQPTFSRTFKKGQILFAKRRAYQKKVAVADFDGICSPHLWALESKGELLQGLLPFIMQRDAFYEYVNANSAGTMSTYLKWPALSKYKFKLPPKEEQEKILSLFLTLEKQIEQTEEQEKKLNSLRKSLIDTVCAKDNVLSKTFQLDKWVNVKLGDIAYWYQRNIPNDQQEKEGIKFYIIANNISSDEIEVSYYSKLADGAKGPTITKHFRENDFLLSTRSVALRKASVAKVSGVTSEKIIVIDVKEDSLILKELLPYFIHSTKFWTYAQISASGSVNKFTSWTKIKDYEFFLPPKGEQKLLLELFMETDRLISLFRDQLDTLKKLKHQLLDEILG